MAGLTKHNFSEVESLSGCRFTVAAETASGADIFHVVPSNSSILDEVWLYAHNYSNSDVEVVFMMGLTGVSTDRLATARDGVAITIPFRSGRALVFDGYLISHSLSAAVYAETGDSITIDGFVNRITS